MIRPATIDDLPAILELGGRMHMESRFRNLPFDLTKVAGVFSSLIEGAGLVLVAEMHGRVVGGIAAMVVEHWFSTVKVAQDFALFIEPEHRGSMLAVRLLARYEAWAREQGATAVEMGINTGVHVEQTAKLFELRGFRQVAVLMAKEA